MTSRSLPLDGIDAPRRPLFPFTALVGQPLLQRALLLAAIDPGIGGLLISGPRGTAKSIAARSLADLLPGAPFVNLPLGASLDRLIGSLNLDDVPRGGVARMSPGLVAQAHGGVLHADEVNLLPDTVTDALLDVAASGINTVERDGVSRQHATRFVLIGTMNPKDGALRPQLLERFGLSVRLSNPFNSDERLGVLRARLDFDADPHAFASLHADEMRSLVRSLALARAALPRLTWSDAVLLHAATRATEAGADGVRADLVMLRAARALAAFEGRTSVIADDVDAVAELALAHRRPAGGGSSKASQASQTFGPGRPTSSRRKGDPATASPSAGEEAVDRDTADQQTTVTAAHVGWETRRPGKRSEVPVDAENSDPLP